MKPAGSLRGRIPKYVNRIVDRLIDAGHEAYPVGGGIRDLLLGRKVVDWDVTTNARPDDVSSLFPRVIPTGIEHGTVTVLLGRSQVEVTTFRGDVGYTDGRHPDRVVFLDSLREDLKRRDFTVNAMAYDTVRQRIIDPQQGRRDLKKGIIRAVGDPLRRFSEDGLRPLRAVRFACVLGFRIEAKTFGAIGKRLEIFRKVAPERVREELQKILGSNDAHQGIELLLKCGLLKEILPELTWGIGFAQNRFHRHDVYTHTIKCLERARGDPVLKLSVLLHDIGKPKTAEGPEGERTFYGHEKASADMANRVLRRLRFSNQERRRVSILISNHMFHYLPEWTDGAVRRLVRRVGREFLTDLYELRRADAWGQGKGTRDTLANLRSLKSRVDQVLTQDAALRVTDLAIGGEEVMQTLNIQPGPRVGKILDALLERVLDEPSLNKPKILKSLLENLEI
jgi:tRNA nucleotidyltransferase (CCA-adding enzyme)